MTLTVPLIARRPRPLADIERENTLPASAILVETGDYHLLEDGSYHLRESAPIPVIPYFVLVEAGDKHLTETGDNHRREA